MVCRESHAQNALTSLPLAVATFDVSGAQEHELQKLLVDVRAAQRCLDGLTMRIGRRSRQLAHVGRSAPADETLRGQGQSTVGDQQARQEAKRSEAADAVPGLDDAVVKGKTSGEHVDAIARHTSKLSDEQRSKIDFDDVLAKAAELPPDEFNRLMKRLADRARADHGQADAKAKRAASEFRHWFDHKTGMGRFTGLLDPERYEAFVKTVDQQVSSLAATSDEPVTKSHNLAAHALVDLVLATGGRKARNRLPSITVLVDHDTLQNGPHENSVRQTEDGHDISPETLARLCCDATLRKVVLDADGVPINVGRKYRTATDAQWAALKAAYSSCAWQGCTAPLNWCQAHHIKEWEHGGPTDLENLVPLCSRHHHQVHDRPPGGFEGPSQVDERGRLHGKWHIKLLPDRTLKIFKPDGAHHSTVPPPRRE